MGLKRPNRSGMITIKGTPDMFNFKKLSSCLETNKHTTVNTNLVLRDLETQYI